MPNRITFCSLHGPTVQFHLILGLGDTCVQFDVPMQIPYIRHMLKVEAKLFIRWETLSPAISAPYSWVGESIVGELTVNSGTGVSLYVNVSSDQRT
jgi:hypothetical protein